MKHIFTTFTAIVTPLVILISVGSLVSCGDEKGDQTADFTEDNKVLLGTVQEFSPEHQIMVFKPESGVNAVLGEELEVHRPMQGKLGKVKVTRIDVSNNVIITDTVPSSFTTPNPEIQLNDTVYRVRE